LEYSDNEAVRQVLGDLVERSCFPKGDPVRRNPWAILDFSSCFSMERTSSGSREGIFVKVPKADVGRPNVLPATEEDRSLAMHEYESLRYLERHWVAPDLAVSYVQPIAFYKKHNAIVTRRAYGWDVLGPFRNAGLRRRLLSTVDEDDMHQRLYRLGAALRIFHDKALGAEGFKGEAFEARRVLVKIDRAADRLGAYGIDRELLSGHLARLHRWWDFRTTQTPTMTLKGLDIRNALMDGDDRIFLLDPGRLKKDFVSADLGRLLITCRILYWGSLWFFFRLHPGPSYEQALLRGYGHEQQPGPVLCLYLLKELYKQWAMAHFALSLKRVPETVMRLLRTYYIDPFYRKQITVQLEQLEK
jgi:hypothetical protein